MRFFAAPLACVAFLGAGLSGQEASRQTFEVASIRRNTGNTGFDVRVEGARFRAVNAPGFYLLALAYSREGAPLLRPFQIVGAPAWLDSERYDIVAVAGTGAPADTPLDRVTMRPFLRSLFEDRFNLQARREQLPMPIYELVRLENSRLGPRLSSSTRECATPEAPCFLEGGPYGLVRSDGITMGTLAQLLAGSTDRVVHDRTGLTGRFAVHLEWSPDQGTTDDRPSLFTAVREQLGLDLVSGTAPVDVVVVEHISRPTEN